MAHVTSPEPVRPAAPVNQTPGSPFVELDRATWARLSNELEQPFDEADLARLLALGDRLDLDEVREVYLPLSRLLALYVEGTDKLHAATSRFLGEHRRRTPFVIGVAGSVAVGKSTTARVLQELLRRWPGTPKVDLVTTDGFLFPNAELLRRGIMERKGFPESYDQKALLRFISAVKSGAPKVEAPRYSHLSYDIVPGERIVVDQPDVLIVEGLNVLAPARPRADGTVGLALSDFFDFSIYVDARTRDIERWYVDRFMRLRSGAFADPASFFHRYASLSDAEAVTTALGIWRSINEPNLRENVRPTRGRARLVLSKDADHSIHHMLLRKL
ncbi:type I pantothenate kinase [Galactobacter valiniphilus]|uniref:Pantothenate kinase n=1 Tax=Galactobacter valiniphilus TaxID=2676122 RepID=A0A399JCZ7_9MICC|nr:type I pantothenate kinase [Galactobacter valiniphilus]